MKGVRMFVFALDSSYSSNGGGSTVIVTWVYVDVVYGSGELYS